MTLLMMLALLASPPQDRLEQMRDKKLNAAFMKHAPWITDYDEALAKSKESGKPIFAYFSRSYAP